MISGQNIYKYAQLHIIILSPKRFGHSFDHHQGVLQQERYQYTNNCTKIYDQAT